MKKLLLLCNFIVHATLAVHAVGNAIADKCADIAKPDDRTECLMYAPWRASYAQRPGNMRPSVFDIPNRQQANECCFCKQHTENDDQKYLILKRFSTCYVMMNAYPFSIGHIMILPYAHKAFLHELNPAEHDELTRVITASTVILEKVIRPEGLNIGFNIGAASGASVPSHLHAQIVPRWTGDSAFIGVIAQTRVITTDIQIVYQDLKIAFDLLPVNF